MKRRGNNLVITYPIKRRRRKNESKAVNESLVNNKKGKKETVIEESAIAPTPAVCQFCHSSEVNEVDLGPIHTKKGVTVHYYCLLLSSALVQTTWPSDKRSILGFTLQDIEKEQKRGKRLRCCYCHKKGATIGCSIHNCKKTFHLCCGRKRGTMHHFFDTFKSFCRDHWLHPNLDLDTPLPQDISKICPICQISVDDCNFNEILSPLCCKRNYFHHSCMQRYALSAGMHFFKCPLCNESKDFQKAMLSFGIYIPDRDASWEREPNAFEEMLERPLKCDVSPCICPLGDEHNARSGNFKLLKCHWCGSYCAHRACAGISTKTQYLTCPACECDEH